LPSRGCKGEVIRVFTKKLLRGEGMVFNRCFVVWIQPGCASRTKYTAFLQNEIWSNAW
jgi:hypothetical protein